MTLFFKHIKIIPYWEGYEHVEISKKDLDWLKNDIKRRKKNDKDKQKV